MARVVLKNILSKKNDTEALVLSIIEDMKAHISITDERHNYVCGNNRILTQFEHPVKLNEEVIGWVKGDEKAIHISSFLSILALKEFERKNLGNEVLMLYQEVNMVFNFSDKLAKAIDTAAIARITIEEAMHLIDALSGIVVLWDESKGHLQISAASDLIVFNKEKITTNAELLLQLGSSGQSDIMSDLTALRESGIIKDNVQSIIYSALKVKHRIMGAIILAGSKPNQYAAADLKFLTTLALQASSAIESSLLYEKNIRAAREREEAMRRVYEIAAKFVPYEFIGSLGHKVITDVKLGDQVEKNVTVLFTDIRDYTTISEQMAPDENFQFVKSYNERMGPIIRNNNGFINQYLGDAIMALFPGSAEKSLIAAIQMQQSIQEFNTIQKAKHQPIIKMGVGMHTGPLVMGITGDSDRLDATIISDTVNTASRIESLTKYYKVDVLLSENTLWQIPASSNFHLRYLGKVQVKGRQSSIGLYECFNGDTEEIILKKIKTLSSFDEGIEHYFNRSFAKAVKCFTDVTEVNPDDRSAFFFLNSTIQYLQKGVSESWSGVVEMTSK